MLKRTLLFFLAGFFATAAFGQKESFHDDSRNFDIKFDFAGYSGSIKDNQTDSIRSTAAASVMVSPQMAWAVSNGVSIGWSLVFSHYLDSAGSAAQMNGLDANFLLDLHFVRTPRVDMMFGFKLGFGGLRLDANDGTGDIYGSMGLAGDVHLMGRFYVAERIAILLNLGVPGYTFNKFGKNLNDTYTIKFNGVCFGTGIALKLLNQRTAGSARNK